MSANQTNKEAILITKNRGCSESDNPKEKNKKFEETHPSSQPILF